MLLLPKKLGAPLGSTTMATFLVRPTWFVKSLPVVLASTCTPSSMRIGATGVLGYLVIRTEDQAVDWFEFVDGQYQAQKPDEGGRLSSKLFLGLWLDTAALLLAGDLAKLFAVVDEGTATSEHLEFVKAGTAKLIPNPHPYRRGLHAGEF